MILSEKFTEALTYFTNLHKTQTRKGGLTKVPYVSHLLQVTGIVLEYGGDEIEAIAAMGHDSIEDRPNDGKTRQEIFERFGSEVLSIIEQNSLPKIDKTKPEQEWPDLIKEKRLEYFAKFNTKTEGAVRVACADKLHNLRSLLVNYRERGEAVFTSFKGGREGTIWYFEKLIEHFAHSHYWFANDIAKDMRTVLDQLA